jgi:hypothetical protein
MFPKVAPKVSQVNGQNIYNKAQFESPKHQHQITFDTLKNLQQTMFLNCLFGQKSYIWLNKKITQNVSIILGYFIFSKNHTEPPKSSPIGKNWPIRSPCIGVTCNVIANKKMQG